MMVSLLRRVGGRVQHCPATQQLGGVEHDQPGLGWRTALDLFSQPRNVGSGSVAMTDLGIHSHHRYSKCWVDWGTAPRKEKWFLCPQAERRFIAALR
ncbi:hypothetical protein NDU88_010877 [Pleurodeles waltl]|uniref:Uncharacterized protein n=1 Tax=Pleurodeles waltl TaxID=8319 RepID=A0AAV7S226_PLEWA|nr:hypothetical protein NDU88_010877 [Pleurodeles waltl]